MENNISDKIDLYLDGKLSPEEKTAFENELSSNSELRQQVETQRNLRQGIERLQLKSTISSQFRKMTLKSKIYKWGIATIAVAAIGTASYFGYNQMTGNNYTLPKLNEEGKAEWSTADKNLPTQTFSIDPNKDTVLETEGGIVFAIPAGAFVDAKDPVTLEVREALTPMDIMQAGLSTTSDGKLLETGGMFYLNARNGEQSLKINPAKSIYANVPTNEVKPEMMVFDGERKADGSINWKNPKPLEKQLIPVDIHLLDFYPKGFRAKVAELGFDANDKKVTDSIYYSYAGRKNLPSAAPQGEKISMDSARVRHILIAYVGAERAPSNITRTKEQALVLADQIKSDIKSGKVKMENIVEKYTDDPGSKSGNKGDYGWFTEESGFVKEFKDAGFNNPVGAVVVIETPFGYHVIQVIDQTKKSAKYLINGKYVPADYVNQPSPDGAALFHAKCASCHNASEKKLTGPGLKGVLDRVPSSDWARAFVRNSAKVISSGDAYATKIYVEYNKSPMTMFGNQLTDAEIDAILGYASSGGFDPGCLEINPARIGAIWTDEFQNTIIATKEFEERLQVMFAHGSGDLLELYVNNLDKKIYQIDSMAFAKSSLPEFKNFYLRHDGGISITEPHMKKLQAYFKQKQTAMQQAAEKTLADRKEKEQGEDKTHTSSQGQQAIDDAKRDEDNFNKEFDINLAEACRQLGIKHTYANAAYGVPLTTTGWKNIDYYVDISTRTRSTLDYTDLNSGKKAVIQYQPINITVLNAKDYDQLTVYLVPDSLNSFMKVNGSNGKYTENLNELLRYSLVVMGEKDGNWFWVKRNDVRPSATEISLEAISETQLKAELDYSFSSTKRNDFKKEFDVMKEEHNYQLQLKARKKQEEIDSEIMPVIFPFYSKGTIVLKDEPRQS